MVCSSDQSNVEFLFKSGLKGLPIDASLGLNFINWLVEAKIECNSFKFRRVEIDFIAKV